MKSMLHKRGRRVHVSSIDIEHGSEGPAHDPYGVRRIWVGFSNGRMLCYREGSLSGDSIYSHRRGKKGGTSTQPAHTDADVAKLRRRFERLTGFSIEHAEKLFMKHFYFEDPMGSPSQYI